MIYRDFQDKKLSLLGFGAMRLPTREDGSVDEELVRDIKRNRSASDNTDVDPSKPSNDKPAKKKPCSLL